MDRPPPRVEGCIGLQSHTITSVDEMRIALRRIEKHHAKPAACPAKTASCKCAQDREMEKEQKEEKTGLEELRASIQHLTAKLKTRGGHSVVSITVSHSQNSLKNT